MSDGSGIWLPTDRTLLLRRSLDLIEACKSSQVVRASYYRILYALSETGRGDGSRSKVNKLYSHLDRLASHLFSPTGLRFAIDFENHQPPNILKQGQVAARVLTRDWDRTNTDMKFQRGVFEALRYGACFLKQWTKPEPDGNGVAYHSGLVMPWNIGVTNERVDTLDRQDAICETITLTLPEVWRRISHLPNAKDLYRRIEANAQKGVDYDEQNQFAHPVLSTSVLNTGLDSLTRPVPGGIVQLNNDPNYALVGPEIGVPIVKLHELWVRDEYDWVTIQLIDPDIIVSPSQYTQLGNALLPTKRDGDGRIVDASELHPYTKIQANETEGYLWGRTELADLIEPQALLTQWADDITRILGVQFDKFLGFKGIDGLVDEQYDQMRMNGYANLGDNGSIQDLTPAMPPNAIELIQFAMSLIDTLGGFDNIMNGQGQQGIRSGEQADLAKQMASPRLLDRSLLIERQCAQAADLRLSLREAKDGDHYWTDGATEETQQNTRFILHDLPEDRRVAVDSHSGSPVFKERHEQMIFALAKAGFVDGEYVLENVDIPNKDAAIQALRAKEEKNQQMIQELIQKDPEAAIKLLTGKKGHH